jgi:bisphosphoglycerate-independent phosphoglycerate mutase (AlkP superfamily)
MVGDNVRAAHRFPYASITDVAPTVCYLLGLPIVQSMDGRVILDAVQPAWVDDHPLRVVD